MENLSIQQLIKIIKNNTDMTLLSEKEFNEYVMDRRPIELLLMAQAFTSRDIFVSNSTQIQPQGLTHLRNEHP